MLHVRHPHLGRLSIALLTHLHSSIQASQDIKHDYPDIDYPGGFDLICGLLAVPLSSEGKDFIVFFRKGQREEISWAGNPVCRN